MFSVAKIQSEEGLQGYLYIILGGEVFDSIVEKLRGSYILQLSAWWIAASLFFVLAAGLMIFAYLTRRLKRLANALDSFDVSMQPDQLAVLIETDRRQGDEIDRLSVKFKQLVERIQHQMEKIKTADAQRRELIANVSHDLRTPLATLRGYIETLFLKDDTLTAQDRRHHLEIAIQHCERLGKLVDALFELAKLDSEEIAVQHEPFNISELAHDVIQKFDLSARQKDVSIQIDQDSHLPFVNADIAMIERVIENLIENALRHTPAGGAVRLSFNPQNGDISVCVSDTGQGIPEEDLPYIFERFYQRDKSRSDKTGYAGLGLAIARRILELHNKPIRVESTPGSGTTFSFQLPVHQPA